jgi:putative FmdB family regulatory protein
MSPEKLYNRRLYKIFWEFEMPIYAYRCEECGFAKDALQKMSDAPLTDCPSCGKASFKKQLTAAGFQLKGTGWYVTDFRSGQGAAAAKPTGESAGDSASNASGNAESAKSASASSTGEAAATPSATPTTPAAAPAASKSESSGGTPSAT